ncbi:MAG: TIGR00282 family metallophosphoesterase [Oscillospiraceae bacterium]|nr:TIGR00282 family metallophosphoesterase [Oscillospiraceae bacterium]
MVILVIGDIVGASGCEHVKKVLPKLKEKYSVDMVVANGENSADGNGATPASAKLLFDAGVNVITGGNHILRRRQIYEALEKKDGIIRPANYHESAPGAGWLVYDNPKHRVLVVNLQGTAYMQNIKNPLDCIDEILKDADTPNIIIDFHAEATAEKLCLAYYLDGKVTAVLGTHTHVPTADAGLLPNGTAYVTDLGMCGGRNSVLGVTRDLAIERMRTMLPTYFKVDAEDVRLSGAVLDVDEKTGKCREINQLLYIGLDNI